MLTPSSPAARLTADSPADTISPQQGPPHSGRILRAFTFNFSWTIFGNITYAGCQWLMLVVLARLGTPTVVGKFALGLTITAPVMMLTNLQLRALQATDAGNEHQFGDYLVLRLITTVSALSIIGVIAAISQLPPGTTSVIVIIAIAKAIESVSDVFYGSMQRQERLDLIAHSMILKGVLSVCALTGAYALSHSLAVAAAAIALVWTISLLSFDVPMLKRLMADGEIRLSVKPVWRPKHLQAVLRLGLPLGVTMMLISLTTNIPRYFVQRTLGEEQLGIFAALAYTLTAGMTFVTAMGQAASPWLSRHYADANRDQFWSVTRNLVATVATLGFVQILVAQLWGRQILTLVYGRAYGEATTVFVWTMVAASLWYITSVLGFVATAMRRVDSQPIVLSTVTGVTALASIYLIPSCGISGAAMAMAAGALAGTAGFVGVVTVS